MQLTDLHGILISRGIPSRIRGHEVQVQVCLYCGNDRYNLELNPEMGVWHCWACGSKGTVRTFLSEHLAYTADIPVRYKVAAEAGREVPPDHHDLATRPIYEIESALAYLARRGVSLHEAMQYQMLLCVEPGKLENRILIPAREYFSQRLLGYVARDYLGASPAYRQTFQSSAVTGLRVFNSGVHLVVEGPLDGIAVHRVGYNAAVLLGVAKDATLDAWAARIPTSHTIIILMDGDAHERGRQLQWRLQPIHPRVLKFDLPKTMDPGALEPEALRQIVATTIAQTQEETPCS